MQFRPQPRGGAADRITAARPQRIESAGEEFGAHVVHQHVNPGVAGQRLHPFHHILFPVVDHLVGPQLPGLGRLVLGAGGSDYPRPHHVLRHLDCRGAHSGRGGQHQHRLPGLKLRPAHHHIPHWQEGCGNGGSLLVTDRIGNFVSVYRRHGNELGVTAVGGAAHEPGAGTEVVPTRHAGRALVAAYSRIYHHPVARLQASDAFSGFNHIAGAVPAQDQRRRKLPA